MFCYGYISGIEDSLTATAHVFIANKDNPFEYWYATCIREGTTYDAAVQVVVNYGQRHPEDWSSASWSVVFDALHETWACH
jgi:hypothetical protein